MTDEARRGRAALARIAGGAYALNIAAILLAILMTRGGFAAADPATLAASIAAHAPALRWAFALDVVSTAASVVVAALLYRLLRPVDAGASFAAAAFRLSACAVALVGYVLQFAPLTLLGEGRPIGGIAPQTVQAMALLLYRLHGAASNLVIALFGFHFLVLGGLIFRSGFLPRALGVLVALAGAGAIALLAPGVRLQPYLLPVAFAAEVSLAGWLLLRGVRARPKARTPSA